MSGVRIMGELILASEPITAIAPPDAIKAWQLPDGVGVPSILATRISRVKMQFLAAQGVWLVTERVQITVRASSGVERELLLGLVERAGSDKIGTIAGFANVAVLSAGGGPDFDDDTGTIFMGSHDFRVSFNEPA